MKARFSAKGASQRKESLKDQKLKFCKVTKLNFGTLGYCAVFWGQFAVVLVVLGLLCNFEIGQTNAYANTSILASSKQQTRHTMTSNTQQIRHIQTIHTSSACQATSNNDTFYIDKQQAAT